MSTGAEQSKRNRSWSWRTVVRRADLYGRSAGALASRRWPRRDADVVDGVGREVVEPVRVDRRRDGDADVLAQVRVVVVELVRVDRESGAAVSLSGLVPRQLDGRRRRRLALQVRRLLRHYSTASRPALCVLHKRAETAQSPHRQLVRVKLSMRTAWTPVQWQLCIWRLA